MSIDEQDEQLDEGRMTLAEHLTELRSRLIKIVVAVVVGGSICFMFRTQIFDVLLHPLREVQGDDASLLVTDPLTSFGLALKVSGYGGLVIAMPVILWQLWRFVTPGLYPHEKRYAVPFVLSALVLFVLGAGLAYWTLPRALDFFQGLFGDEVFEYIYAPDKYVTLVVYMMLAFGIGFEFPILLIFLQMADLVQPRTLAKGRPYAIVGIFVAVAVITPSGDPISLIALALPMCVFYEISILIGRIFARRRRRRDQEQFGTTFD